MVGIKVFGPWTIGSASNSVKELGWQNIHWHVDRLRHEFIWVSLGLKYSQWNGVLKTRQPIVFKADPTDRTKVRSGKKGLVFQSTVKQTQD